MAAAANEEAMKINGVAASGENQQRLIYGVSVMAIISNGETKQAGAASALAAAGVMASINVAKAGVAPSAASKQAGGA